MRRRRGMTLIEVLVAVVVCGAGVAIVAAAAASSLRAEAFSEGLTRAAAQADLVLARLESGELPLEDVEGDFSEEGEPETRYKVALGDTPTENLRAAKVTITWQLNGVDRELDVERWFFVDPEAGTR